MTTSIDEAVADVLSIATDGETIRAMKIIERELRIDVDGTNINAWRDTWEREFREGRTDFSSREAMLIAYTEAVVERFGVKPD